MNFGISGCVVVVDVIIAANAVAVVDVVRGFVVVTYIVLNIALVDGV